MPTSPPNIQSGANTILAKIKGGPYEFYLLGGSQDGDWIVQASRELISLLRDDHDTLMTVLGALSDAVPEIAGQE